MDLFLRGRIPSPQEECGRPRNRRLD
jgi:hypothetical protein